MLDAESLLLVDNQKPQVLETNVAAEQAMSPYQDIDPAGLSALNGSEILGASSDHLIVATNGCRAQVGTELVFALNYSALLRAMTSRFVRKDFQARKRLGPKSSETVLRAE